MLFQFLSRHICRIVVVEMMIYAGDVLYVIEHFGYIMAYDDNGALPVDLFQHLVHLLLETAVDVGVGLIQYHYIGFGNNGAGEEYSLQLSAAQGCDMAVFNSVSCICSRQSRTCWCCAWVYLEKRLLVLLSPESTTS